MPQRPYRHVRYITNNPSRVVLKLKDVSNFSGIASFISRGKGEKSEVRAHSMRGQPRMVENTCPVQLPLRRLEPCGQPEAQRDDYIKQNPAYGYI